MKNPLQIHTKNTPAAASKILALELKGLVKLKLSPPLLPPLLKPPLLLLLLTRSSGWGMSVLLGLLLGLLVDDSGFFLPPKIPAIRSLKSRHNSSKSGGPSGLAGCWFAWGVLLGSWATGSTFGACSPPCSPLASLDLLLGSVTENRPSNLRIIRYIASIRDGIKFRRFWSLR